MAAATTPLSSLADRGRKLFGKRYDESAANTSLALSTATGKPKRVLWVSTKYSANVSVDVTIEIDNGLGATYDTTIETISLIAARNGFWLPDGELWIDRDDIVKVTAPAGGAAVTSTIVIAYMEEDV